MLRNQQRGLSQSRGFTLLEVMVAVAVLAIALSATIKVASESGANLIHLRDKTLAHWVAENKLAELQATEAWTEGSQRGSSRMGGRTWYWQVDTTTTELPNIRQVLVQVSEQEKGEQWVTSLTGFLADPQLREAVPGAAGGPGEAGNPDGAGEGAENPPAGEGAVDELVPPPDPGEPPAEGVTGEATE
jgi:general secretion pathway protein I